MKRVLQIGMSIFAILLFQSISVFAGDGNADSSGNGLSPTIIIGIAAIIIAAKLGGEIFERLGQPAVLGELIAGILVGNISLLGLNWADFLKNNEVIGSLAEIGVIILLFEVGLESKIGDMMKVGVSSLLVAIAGVIVPFFLGWAVAMFFLPESSQLTHIFIGATLCATSVGITARVLKDLGQLSTKESRIILGAAVIDDVLGLLILAVIGGAIKSAQLGVSLGFGEIILIAVKAGTFLIAAIAVGHFVMPHLFRRAGCLERRGILLAVSISFCFLLAWLASLVGLAPIVGAFAAGLVLDEVHFEPFTNHEELTLNQLIMPISSLLVPVFFVLMGLRVDLSYFLHPSLLLFAGALTFVAVIGKQVCSFAAIEKNINRVAIGVGMIPRGEVGLIMAGIGMQLTIPNVAGNAESVVSQSTFGVIVLMVIATTLVTPSLLKWSLKRGESAIQVNSHIGVLADVPSKIID
jgi:Kef-type K+ transport system membrane component KefB